MRVVLDTNVLISALIGHGKPRRLLVNLLRGHEIVSSKQMLAELEDVLSSGRFELNRCQVNGYMSIVVRGSDVVAVKDLPEVVKEDPDDNVDLATAFEGRASYIVTGDRHLLVLGECCGVKIMSVAEMLDILRSG